MTRRPVAGGGCFTWNLAATEWNKPQIVRSEFSLWIWRWPINFLHLTVLISFRATKRQLKQDLRLQKTPKNLKSLVTCLYLSVVYLHMSKPAFFITTVMVEEVPSFSVPKSTLDGMSWKPLTMVLVLEREPVWHFLLTCSSACRSFNRGHRQRKVNNEKLAAW